jgi:NAD(P)-dependent dehydrogenase (short-subunit alcohol dehydrogenase family)
VPTPEAAVKAKEIATNPEFETLIFICDIFSENGVINLMTKAVEKFGKIDYAVNNAGVIRYLSLTLRVFYTCNACHTQDGYS